MKGRVLLTGGSKRIGRAIAVYLAQKGYDIALHSRTAGRSARASLLQIRKYNKKAKLYACDFGDPAAAGAFFRAVIKDGRLGALINNASIYAPSSVSSAKPEFLYNQFLVNAFVPIELMRLFKKYAKKGVIINLLDAKVNAHQYTHSAYLLSKKTLAQATLMAAREFAPDVRVNGICPGVILPPPGKTAAQIKTLWQHVPMKRKGSTGDIAQAAEYLLKSTYVTGQLLFVDGGMHLCERE